MGLESLNENLPEIVASLQFKGQQVELKPVFEELKSKYFE
jgi:hypothetical protein